MILQQHLLLWTTEGGAGGKSAGRIVIPDGRSKCGDNDSIRGKSISIIVDISF